MALSKSNTLNNRLLCAHPKGVMEKYLYFEHKRIYSNEEDIKSETNKTK